MTFPPSCYQVAMHACMGFWSCASSCMHVPYVGGARGQGGRSWWRGVEVKGCQKQDCGEIGENVGEGESTRGHGRVG